MLSTYLIYLPQKDMVLTRCWWSIDNPRFDQNKTDRVLLPYSLSSANRRYTVSRLRLQTQYAMSQHSNFGKTLQQHFDRLEGKTIVGDIFFQYYVFSFKL